MKNSSWLTFELPFYGIAEVTHKIIKIMWAKRICFIKKLKEKQELSHPFLLKFVINTGWAKSPRHLLKFNEN